MAISKLGLGHVRLFGALEYIQKREDRKIELRKQMKGETNGTWLPFVLSLCAIFHAKCLSLVSDMA